MKLKAKGYLTSDGYLGKVEDSRYPNGQKKEEYQYFATEEEYLEYVDEINREDSEECRSQK